MSFALNMIATAKPTQANKNEEESVMMLEGGAASESNKAELMDLEERGVSSPKFNQPQIPLKEQETEQNSVEHSDTTSQHSFRLITGSDLKEIELTQFRNQE